MHSLELEVLVIGGMMMDTCAGNDAKDDVERSYVFVNNDSDDSNVGDLDMEMDLKSDLVSSEVEEETTRKVASSEDISGVKIENEINAVSDIQEEPVTEIQMCGAPSIEISSSSSDSITSEMKDESAEPAESSTENHSPESTNSFPHMVDEEESNIAVDNPSVEQADNLYSQNVDQIAESATASFPLEIGEFAISCNTVDSPELERENSVSEKKQVESGVEEKIISAVEPETVTETTHIQVDSSESSRTDPKNAPGENSSEQKKELPIYIIRVPRFSDNNMRTKIEKAQREVEEKTKNRDAIRVHLQNQKDVCMMRRKKVEDVRKEERESRDAVASKRQEIDSVQSMLDKLKNMHLINDINNKIEEVQHRISHETNTLKEEKLLMREINQLKQSREHLSSSLASDEELQEAFENREQMQTHVQKLKEELDFLRKKVQLAEGEVKSARNGSDKEHEILRDLQAKYKEADDLQQEAYLILRDLKRESYTKNLHFYSYKDDQKAVANFIAANERDSLRVYCHQQVEKIMEMWNNDSEFRKRYEEVNVQSVVRRFKTLDGRSLGLDEEPVVIPAAVDQRKTIDSTAHQPLTPTLTPTLTKTKEKADSTVKPALTREEVKPSRDKVKEKKSAEEEEFERKARELTRREEEMKREKEVMEERERLRLDQITKAKEAEERKRKKAEKTQARAEIKAQKEAEIREKKKKTRQEKKKRKKERSNANPIDTESEDKEEKEAVDESEKSTQDGGKKKPIKPVKSIKEPRSLPLLLRNKGKRKLQAWFWPILVAIIILSIFVIIITHQR